MLTGNNELWLNEATMQLALEEYLNKRIVNIEDEVVVTGVDHIPNYDRPPFRVRLQSKAEAA